MKIIESFVAGENHEKLRIVDYILQNCNSENRYSRNYLKKLIKKNSILLDGKFARTADFVRVDQHIKILIQDDAVKKIYKLSYPVIFEDDYLAVIDKPAGIAVSGNQFRTVENALLFNLKPSNQIDAYKNPKPVHRLDALTSGLLIIAKTLSIRKTLGRFIEMGEIKKKYRAIAIGKTPDKATIDFDIDNKKAVTEFKTLYHVQSLNCGYVSLLDINLITGRTHQIRIHLSKLGFPILGDKIYGNPNSIYRGKGLFLASVKLSFNHPVTKEHLALEISPPGKFAHYLNREKKRFDAKEADKQEILP